MAKKMIPMSEEAENGVLGSILLDKKGFTLVKDILIPSSFYLRENQLIYEAMCFLHSENKPIDILTVRTYLDDRDLLEQIGGNTKLIALTESIFTSTNIEQYARTVRSKYLRRQILLASESIKTLGHNEEASNEEIFSNVGSVLKALSSLHTIKENSTIEDDVQTYQEWLEERAGKKVFGYSWGENLQWLDESTDGIQRKKTYRIGANSNLGKSQLVYNVICNLLKQGARVAFFTLENERVTTLNYLLANLQGINSRALVRGETKPDLNLLFPYKDLLTIIDNVNELGDITKRIEKGSYDVVILDYIGLMRVKGVTTEGKFAEYAERIPQIAKENNLSFIDLSNLPKNADDDTIRLYGEFFGSSALRNNLDVGIHLTYYKPFYEWKDDMIKQKMIPLEKASTLKNMKVLNLMITKNRLGPTGIEKPYVVSFDAGGRFREATGSELGSWF